MPVFLYEYWHLLLGNSGMNSISCKLCIVIAHKARVMQAVMTEYMRVPPLFPLTLFA